MWYKHKWVPYAGLLLLVAVCAPTFWILQSQEGKSGQQESSLTTNIPSVESTPESSMLVTTTASPISPSLAPSATQATAVAGAATARPASSTPLPAIVPPKSPARYSLESSSAYEIQWALAVTTSLFFGPDGTAYSFSTPSANRKSVMQAISPEGKTLWRLELDMSSLMLLSMQFTKSGTIAVVSYSNESNNQNTVNLLRKEGTRLASWTVPSARSWLLLPNQEVVISTSTGLLQYDSKGTLKAQAEDPALNGQLNLGPDGSIYLQTLQPNGKFHRYMRMDAYLKPVWEHQMINSNPVPVQFTADGDPLLMESKEGWVRLNRVDGRVVQNRTVEGIFSYNMTCYADGCYAPFSPSGAASLAWDGSVRWSFFPSDRQYGATKSYVTDSKGTVAFANDGGNVFAFDAAGKPLFATKRNSPDYMNSQLFLLPDGRLLIYQDYVLSLVAPLSDQKKTAQAYIESLQPKPLGDLQFFHKQDLDLDGYEEVILAFGYPGAEASDGIGSVYVLRERDGKLEPLTNDIVRAYGVVELKLVRLQNLPHTYIYAQLSNGGPMNGFSIHEVAGNQVKTFAYSAAASGSGTDETKDSDHNGQIDGYVQHRSSYDVLNYRVRRQYDLQDGKFVWQRSSVTIPKYPESVKDVIDQYVALRILEGEKDPEIGKRLAELCVYNNAGELLLSQSDFPFELKMEVQESKDTATATVTNLSVNQKLQPLTFHLVKREGKWQIDVISI
ncbi:hypothetical protein [Paenibacillus koleovorans]|uniref:hypothetical protein n=1 Tax=Paenibacillus koleovorans TaxID=121608 RepID=UPI000FD807E6|nr:hypothetical protein [Paenibacillus koleovorans]